MQTIILISLSLLLFLKYVEEENKHIITKKRLRDLKNRLKEAEITLLKTEDPEVRARILLSLEPLFALLRSSNEAGPKNHQPKELQ